MEIDQHLIKKRVSGEESREVKMTNEEEVGDKSEINFISLERRFAKRPGLIRNSKCAKDVKKIKLIFTNRNYKLHYTL